MNHPYYMQLRPGRLSATLLELQKPGSQDSDTPPNSRSEASKGFGRWSATKRVQELPEHPSDFLRLFKRRIMAGFADHLHLGPGNVLLHHFGFRHAGQDVFVPGDDEGRHVDGL